MDALSTWCSAGAPCKTTGPTPRLRLLLAGGTFTRTQAFVEARASRPDTILIYRSAPEEIDLSRAPGKAP